MQSNKKKKLTKRLWLRQDRMLLALLVFSITLAVTIVSCKKDFLNTPAPTHPTYSGYGGIDGTNQVLSLASLAFEEIGNGFLHQAGTASFGWMMGAFGLSQQDGASSEEIVASLNEINSELITINNTLLSMHTELDNIEDAIEGLTCVTQQDKLGDNISWIRTLTGKYNDYVHDAIYNQLPPSDSMMLVLVDKIINGESTNPEMADILNNFQTYLWDNSSSIIHTCLVPGLIPLPAAGTFQDTTYYRQVTRITEYYYGYYTHALLLFTEAKNYQAWHEAYSLGLVDSTYTTANVSTICELSGGQIPNTCWAPESKMNDAYAGLTTFFTKGGAPYTNAGQLIYNNPPNTQLWARSLEAYTYAFSPDTNLCPVPFIFDGNSQCPLLLKKSVTPLSPSTYQNTSGWEFANKDDLVSLLNLDSVKAHSNIGAYLESIGFEYLTGTSKIIQAYNSNVDIQVKGTDGQTYQGSKIPVVPFFYVNWPVINGSTVVFQNSDDFGYLLVPTFQGWETCSGGNSLAIWNYTGPDNVGGNNYVQRSWFENYADGSLCTNGDAKFYWWTGPPEYQASNDFRPGWTEASNNNGTEGYMWPIKRLKDIQCIEGRTGINTAGALSMCGDDFTAWLKIVLPPPPYFVPTPPKF
jgi:hypothetical protein